MSDKYEKLKDLLKELFQLDKPDLDFGIYRIMHARSKEITQFLDNDLLPQIKDSFVVYQSADKAGIQKELDKVINAVKEAGMDPEESPKVKELRNKLANESVDVEMLERETYDHLYSFFRRYYSEGDFISKRVYKEGVYAIPYEGEEVKLHWANADQYYIKTSEYLRDYAFRLNPSNKSDPKRVHFRLVDVAEGEHGNVKEADDKKRVFILANENFIFIENNELVIQFEYRQATLLDWPEDQREAKKNAPNQKDLITFAEQRLLSIGDVSLSSWIGELGKSHIKADGETADYSKLVAHLNRYTARNTFDYFIHKDLGTFLNRELDFYIKNEVMHLDDIENETAPRVEQYLSKIKVIRLVAKKIIDFLAQLEDFQKKLWLKKKFVVETNYCLTLDRVPEEFYPEIVNNKDQIEEWIKLFAIDEIQAEKGDLIESDKPGYSIPLTVEFLKANDKLVLDTKFFSDEFKAKLIGGIENFDEQMDGLLIHSENFQALNLLQARYREQVSQLYTDPPYNAKSSEILYKNNYKHSSWNSLMFSRLQFVQKLLSKKSSVTIAIDENEYLNLGYILKQIYPEHKHTCVTVIHNPGGIQGKNFSYTHEYAYFVYPSDGVYIGVLNRDEVEATPLRDWGGEESKRDTAATCFYPIYIKDGEIIGFGDVCEDNFHPDKAVEELEDGDLIIYPIDSNGVERKWRFARDTIESILHELKCEKVNNEWAIRRYKSDYRYKTVWFDKNYNANTQGSKLLGNMLGGKFFDFPKSLFTVQDSILAVVPQQKTPIVLDCFAGSGTTGHAIIDMQRRNKGYRKYILIEGGNHFNTALFKRILKCVYSQDWKNGKPTSRDTGISHCFKYLRLESYEDTLNNLDLQRSKEQENMLNFKEEGADKFKEDYILRYMLDVESRGSASLLNIDAFNDPTAYKMKVKIPGSDESREVKVDLIETFNYLLGLEVKNISAPQIINADFERNNEGRLRIKGRISEKPDGKWWFRTVTGTTLSGRKILVIWRNFPKTDDAESIEENNLLLDTWFTKKDYSSKDSEFDTIYVNGTNNLENLKTPEDLWKVRLIEEDFMRLMFEDTGV